MDMNLKQILQQPIPDYATARKIKSGFREYPILLSGPHVNEPLVDIADYGIAGQAYYSRPNAATDRPIPDVDAKIYVRKTIAEKLATINYELQKSAVVSELLGGKVELYIEEGYRDVKLQAKLYDEVFPRLIREQHPDWQEDKVLARRDELSGKPPADESSPPSPHATGAAVDVKLRYAQENTGYAVGFNVDMGHVSASTGNSADPDYFEHLKNSNDDQREAQKNRRVFYWTMRGALTGDDSGFAVNPTEWWHWSYGDQMWAKLTNAPQAFYSYAK